MSDFTVHLSTDVSRETSERLATYHGLLKKWNPKINLVSPKTLSEAPERHFDDSAQLMRFIPDTAHRLTDIGSGGGFPGLVLAILCAETHPDLHATLIESDQRKASFLRTVSRETGVPVSVISKRIEQVEHTRADVLTARALAPLTDLISFAQIHLSEGGVALFPKGKTWGNELEEARSRWKFSAQSHTSITDPSAVILEIKEIPHA
jgi:16S rRNA (guanine527-N7)-methyltransferase